MSECVLVGNGKQDRKLGETINSFEHVYRFNRFRVGGFEDYIGTRCTHWILNNALTTDNRDYYVNKIRDVKFNHPNLLSTITITNTDKHVNRLEYIKNNYDNFDYYISDFKLGSKKMSTGILTINYLLDKYEVLNLIGFDFGKTNHYWGIEGPSDIPGNHSWNLEIDYVNNLIENNKVMLW